MSILIFEEKKLLHYWNYGTQLIIYHHVCWGERKKCVCFFSFKRLSVSFIKICYFHLKLPNVLTVDRIDRIQWILFLYTDWITDFPSKIDFFFFNDLHIIWECWRLCKLANLWIFSVNKKCHKIVYNGFNGSAAITIL